MTMGVACATLPTSSSFCMMRLIRACRRKHQGRLCAAKREVFRAYNREFRGFVLVLHCGRRACGVAGVREGRVTVDVFAGNQGRYK